MLKNKLLMSTLYSFIKNHRLNIVLSLIIVSNIIISDLHASDDKTKQENQGEFLEENFESQSESEGKISDEELEKFSKTVGADENIDINQLTDEQKEGLETFYVSAKESCQNVGAIDLVPLSADEKGKMSYESRILFGQEDNLLELSCQDTFGFDPLQMNDLLPENQITEDLESHVCRTDQENFNLAAMLGFDPDKFEKVVETARCQKETPVSQCISDYTKKCITGQKVSNTSSDIDCSDTTKQMFKNGLRKFSSGVKDGIVNLFTDIKDLGSYVFNNHDKIWNKMVGLIKGGSKGLFNVLTGNVDVMDKIEDASSKVVNLLASEDDNFTKAVYQASKGDFTILNRIINSTYHSFVDAITKHIGKEYACERWEGTPFVSKCLIKTAALSCLSCNQSIPSVLSFISYAPANFFSDDILIAIVGAAFTGGAALSVIMPKIIAKMGSFATKVKKAKKTLTLATLTSKLHSISKSGKAFLKTPGSITGLFKKIPYLANKVHPKRYLSKTKDKRKIEFRKQDIIVTSVNADDSIRAIERDLKHYRAIKHQAKMSQLKMKHNPGNVSRAIEVVDDGQYKSIVKKIEDLEADLSLWKKKRAESLAELDLLDNGLIDVDHLPKNLLARVPALTDLQPGLGDRFDSRGLSVFKKSNEYKKLFQRDFPLSNEDERLIAIVINKLRNDGLKSEEIVKKIEDALSTCKI